MALGEIVEFHSGGTPSKANADFWSGDIPWFSAKDMKHPRLFDSADHISASVFESSSIRRLPAGTLAIVVRGMILAHTVPISILDVSAAINQDLKALLPKDDVDTTFLAAMLRAQHAEILSKVTTAAHGTKKLDSRVLQSIKVPFPPLTEQRRIADVLDNVEVLRAKRREVDGRLEALSWSIFHSMFGSREYPTVRAIDLMPRMRNGVSPATAGTHSAQVLTLSAVTQGAFDSDASKPGIFATVPPADKRVSSADFLVCRGNGNKSLVGTGAYSKEDRPDLVFPDTVIAGRVDTAKVLMPFLNMAWKSSAIRRQIEAVARTTNGTFKINQQTLAEVEIQLPPLDAQHQFASRLEVVEAQRRVNAKASAALDELFDSLQDRAFRGEL